MKDAILRKARESAEIHRIQETHVALYHIVWDLVHVALGEDDVI